MNQQIPNNRITLKYAFLKCMEWYRYLLSKWLVILLTGLLGGALGLAYSFTKKPVYTASLSFALEDDQQSGGLSGAIGLASQFGFDLGGGGGGMFSNANLIELFKSRTMIEQTLLSPVTINNKTVSFAEMYIENAEWRKKWISKPELKDIQFLPQAKRQSFSRVQDSVLGVISESILKSNFKIIQKDKKVDIITMEMSAENENFAKYFTEALAKVVSDFYITTRSEKSHTNMEILERQVDSIRRELNGAITGVAVATDNTFALNPALNVQRTTSSKRQVDVQANMAMLTELVKQTELAKITLRKETPLIQIIDHPIFPLKKEKFGKLSGIIIGGFLAGFFIISFLIARHTVRKMLAGQSDNV